MTTWVYRLTQGFDQQLPPWRDIVRPPLAPGAHIAVIGGVSYVVESIEHDLGRDEVLVWLGDVVPAWCRRGDPKNHAKWCRTVEKP